ncbi:MAG: hybrid sensor histidine kinase/response regulator [Geobacter sp.]|nr:MAG: hybrid sensor histidine kinase/response regulator [Geobacter sp.]
MSRQEIKKYKSSEQLAQRNTTLLIVDDEKVNLVLTAQLFRNRGFKVLTASNASDALELVEKEQPEIVLLDYFMPGKDGFSTLTEIKLKFPDIYVIILTGKGSEEIAVTLMKAGASDYVLKPFLNQDLLERVEKVIRVREVEIRNKELVLERDRLLKEIETWNRMLEMRVAEKTMELQKVQEEIVQTEKMSTLGYISAGMAHEIRNPLNSIGLYVQLLKGGLDDPERFEFLEKIEMEVRRIDGILIKLMDAVKRPRYHLQQVSIPKVIDSLLELFQSRAKMHGIRVERDYRANPPYILADATEIEQIFSNLFANAIEEMADGGVLTILLQQKDDTVNIDVTDTGKGIPHVDLQRIFDPFYTTKNSGTGLGLSVVLRIIRTYNGKIEVKSEMGKGTTFSVSLPLLSPGS